MYKSNYIFNIKFNFNFKKIIILFLLFLIFFLKPNIKAEEEIIDDSLSAILIEAKSGKIIYEKDKDKRLYPASMTKIMTMTLTMEAIKNNIFTLNDTAIASKHAKSMGGTTIFLDENEEMKIEDLLKGVAIASGNDAAVTLAEKIAQTEKNFVSKMNEKVKSLNLNNTNFENATGLFSKNHYSSSYDIAMMSKYLINNYPEILNYTKIYDDYLRKGQKNEVWLVNTNKLVKNYPGIDGLKTGYLSESGYCLSATMEKNNIRLIAVVMGAKTIESRNNQIIRLLEYGFNNYNFNTYKTTKTEVSNYYNILMYPHNNKIILKEDIILLEKKTDKLDNITEEYQINEEKIKNNEEIIGKLIIYHDNNIYGEYDLIFSNKTKKANFFQIFLEVLKNILNLN